MVWWCCKPPARHHESHPPHPLCNARYSEDAAAAQTESGAAASLSFNGSFYDNAAASRRGVTALSWRKPKMNFRVPGGFRCVSNSKCVLDTFEFSTVLTTPHVVQSGQKPVWSSLCRIPMSHMQSKSLPNSLGLWFKLPPDLHVLHHCPLPFPP